MANKGKTKRPYLDPDLQRRLQRVPLPPKMKCDRCDKWKTTLESYSQSQRDKAKYSIMQSGAGARYQVSCIRCVGPLTEIECSVCGAVKSVTGFAKSQRTKPDQAKCYVCIDRQLDMGAINEDVYEQDLSRAFVPLDSSAGRMPDYFDPTTQSSQSNAPSSVSGYDSDTDDGGVSLNAAFAGMSMSSIPTNTLIDTTDDRTTLTKSTRTDGWSVATGSRKAPSQYSTQTTSTFGSNVRNQSDRDFKIGSSGFAKIKAYKPEKVAPPEDDDWKSESEGEDEGDDSSGDDDETQI